MQALQNGKIGRITSNGLRELFCRMIKLDVGAGDPCAELVSRRGIAREGVKRAMDKSGGFIPSPAFGYCFRPGSAQGPSTP